MKKKLLICISILLTGMKVFSQEGYATENATAATHDNNEIRINVATAIFGLPEINYERFITDNMGVGLTVAISLEKPEDMTLRSMFLPYYRVYFGAKKASGFFIEGNMAVVGEKEKYSYFEYLYIEDGNYYNTTTATVTSTATSFGFGAAIGYKFLTRNGVIGEICLGGGRLFGNSLINGYPRVGVCIGKRF